MEAISSVLLRNTNTKQDTIETIGLNKLTNTNCTIEDSETIKSHKTVDLLLSDYSDLIVPKFNAWFAKCFYILPFDLIHKLASQARHDGDDPRRLFAKLINENYKAHC